MLDINDARIIRELTGLSEEDFYSLYREKINPYNNQLLLNCPYAGYRSTISPQKFFVVLMYLRTNITMRAVGRLTGLSHQTVSRTLSKVTRVLGMEEYGIYTDKIEQVIVDGTLIRSYDARITSRCRNHQKCANLQVATGNDGRVIALGVPVKGSVHDSKAFCISGLERKLQNLRIDRILGDRAYQGRGISTPIKKPKNVWAKDVGQVLFRGLSTTERRFNYVLNKIRIRIERVISVLKSWGILRICRLVKTSLDLVCKAIMTIYNFRLRENAI